MRDINIPCRPGHRTRLIDWTSLALALILAACGGGGGRGDGPSDAETPASISQQPASVSAAAGTSAVFTVAATGDSLTYQWQISQNQGTTWTDIPGAVSATYTVRVVIPELNGYQFRVAVNGGGGALTSSVATLTATAAAVPDTISVQPTAQSTVIGGTATFSVTATGTSLTYQWQLSIDGVIWADILNAIAASYTVALPDLSMNGYRYRVVVSDGTGTTTSAPATLAVSAAPLASRLGGAAFYQSQINATVIANANLPATMPLGVAGIGSDGTMTWSTAIAWVQALNAAHYLGYADWRLPTVTPLNGSAFQFNNVASDPNGYAGGIDLGFNISARGSPYAGSTASELPFLFYNVLGSVAKYSLTGAAQDYMANTNAPLSNVAAGPYWTSQPYGSTGAMAFDMSEGSQYAYVAESWHFNVIVLRSGDSGP